MKNKTLVFSWWLWALSTLYWFDVISYSPLLPMIFAAIIASYLILYRFSREYHWTKKIFILSLEFFFTYLAYIKNPERSLFNIPDLLFNTIILLIYLIHVKQNGTTTNELYFKTFPESHKDETLFEHVKRILSTK
jgi:hypothetical protein